MLTRIRLGYLPGTRDLYYLRQDLDELDALIPSESNVGSPLPALMAQSKEIEAEARRLRKPELVTKSLLQRSKILLAQERYDEAIKVLTEADRHLGNRGEHDLKIHILAGLAEAHAHLRNWKAVSEVSEEGIKRVEAHRYKVSGQYHQSAYLRARIGLYANGVRAAFERGHYDLMLLRAELSKCRSVLRASQKSSEPGEEELELRTQFREVCRKINDLQRIAGVPARDKLKTLRNERRSLWDLLLIQREESGSSATPPDFDLARLQGLLEADEAVLYYYWVDPDALLIVAIGSDRIHPQIVPFPSKFRAKLDEFCNGVFNEMIPRTPAFLAHLDELPDFSEFLLPTGVREILKRKSRIIISPHRMLHAVPFQALPWDKEHRSLIERFSIIYTPNLTCLLFRYVQRTRRSLMALGINKFNVRIENVPDLADAKTQVSDLDEAEAEVSDLEKLYHSRGHAAVAWRGTDANETSLHALERTGGLHEFTTLHFATHGFNVNSETPMESLLLLQDSVLDGLEIANWRLGAELVVLSACSSGQRAVKGRGLSELPGDDLFGLQAAFFAAGARWVLGSLWPVQSEVTRTMMTAFHRFLLDGDSPDVSLQKATLQYIRSAPGPRMRKNCFWAPFFLSTVGRPRNEQPQTNTNIGNNYG